MYTQCPDCRTLFRVRARNLRQAMGMVRCTHCAGVFNALATLRDEHEVARASVEEIGNQLAVRRYGDEVVIDAQFLGRQAWYRKAQEAARSAATAPDALRAAVTAPAPSLPGTEGTEPLPVEPAEAEPAQVEPDFLPPEPALGRVLRVLLGQTLSLASRNLARHRRRTALGLGAIGFGVVALMLAGGFAEWMQWAEREATIYAKLGHIQIVKKGYYERGVADPYAFLIEESSIPLEEVRQVPHVKVVTPRLVFSGLLSKGETTVSFLGEAVEPATEAEVSRELSVRRGEPLSPEDPRGIVLGKGLAESLGAEPGDTLVLLGTTEGGSISAVEGRVRGIFVTAVKAYDDVALRVPLALGRELVKAEGAHKLIVLLDRTENTEAALAALRARLPEAASGLQYIPWIDLADFYKKVVELFSSQTNFIRAIIAVIIVLSISNTLVMSVVERTGEIGTLMAVGFRRRKVMRLFVGEGLLLGVLGGAAGTLVGLILAGLVSLVGIPMPPAPGMSEGFTAAIRVDGDLALAGFLLAVASAVAASLYPAWKASRLEIVDALRRAR